jgi:hypothetical protein
MMNTQKVLAVAAILAAAGTTFAQVSPGAFAPSATEDYEGTPGGRAVLSSIFGGLVPVIPGIVDHRSVDFGNWSDFRSPGGPVQPTSGSKFGVQYGFGDITLDFTGLGGITGFACSATAAGVGADTIEFFDMAGNPMTGTVTDPDGFGPGDGSMEALSFVSSVAIGSIRLTGRESCFDDIQISTDGITPCVEWTQFQFGAVGEAITFDFDITAGCPTFKITDSFLSGDEFDVRILQGGSEVAAFSSSESTVEGDSSSDPDMSFDDDRWASGFVGLDNGSYTAEVTLTVGPFGGGGGAFWRTDTFLAPPCPVVEGDFTADATDDYESYPGGRATISSLFGGTVPVIPGLVDHRSVDFGNWSDFRSPGGPVQPSSGSRFGVQYGFGDITLDFTGLGGITGFKGMATAAGVGDDVVTFFDMSGVEVCEFTIVGGFGPGDGSMVPFSYVSDSVIGSVRLTGRESCFDDLGYTTSAGCVADCDGDGVLTLFDFLCFQNQFDAGDLAADLDGDGILTLFDFLAFQNAFDAGCE